MDGFADSGEIEQAPGGSAIDADWPVTDDEHACGGVAGVLDGEEVCGEIVTLDGPSSTLDGQRHADEVSAIGARQADSSELTLRSRRVPAALPAAAALSGFIAGATLMALVKRAAARRLGQDLAAAPGPAWPDRDRWAVGESRTFVVNVRLISRSGG
jgi:hypothetical protein